MIAYSSGARAGPLYNQLSTLYWKVHLSCSGSALACVPPVKNAGVDLHEAHTGKGLPLTLEAKADLASVVHSITRALGDPFEVMEVR